jgi:signal transduction histidine kinase
MDIYVWGFAFLAAGIVFTIFTLGVPLFIRAPKNEPTVILITGLILSLAVFSFTTLLLLNQTEYFDGGIVGPIFRPLVFLTTPVTLICILLQILFIRSIRQSVVDYKILIIFIVMAILLSIGAVSLNQYITPFGNSNVNSQFLLTLIRGIAFSGLMFWFFYEAGKTLKIHKNFILLLIKVLSAFFFLQTIVGIAFLATDYFAHQSPSTLETGLAGLDSNLRMMRLGIFCTFEILLTIYWVQHYSLNAIEERQQRKKIQQLLQEKDILIGNLSNSSTLIESGALSAGLAHELNQFLGRIALNRDEISQLINQPDVQLENLKLPLDNILQANQSAANLIVSLKKLFNHGSVDSSLCNVDDLVKDVLLLYMGRMQKSNIDVVMNLRVSEQQYIWESLFRQVIVNLLSNAIEALDGKLQGKKVIKIESRIDPSGNYSLTFTDNGPGVDAKQGETIFNMFATSKPSGSGIGLWLSSYILERHNGLLSYKNLPDNGGVSFILMIPKGVKANWG